MVKVMFLMYEFVKVDVDFIREMFGMLVFKEYIWFIDECLKILDYDEFIQFFIIEKEEVCKKFGILVVIEVELIEEDFQEN